jgi:hypothetical protein
MTTFFTIIALRSFLLAGAHVEVDTQLQVPDDLDAETADLLVRLGNATVASDDANAAPALADMTVTQLKGFAADEGIDLGNAAKKAEIVEAIEMALVERANA